MASTRRSPPAETPGSRRSSRTGARARTLPDAAQPSRVDAAISLAFANHLPEGGAAAVALSGGRDSVVLLDAAVRLAARRAVGLSAIHVHHGLSPNADAWARFCAELCAARGVPLRIARVELRRGRGSSLEAEARALRYAALAAEAVAGGATHVLLAHHRDDQAETLLLQLLRGAGPAGLAAMPVSSFADGVHWLRPLLGFGRAAIEDQARARGLTWVDDESNADPVHRRNALRQQVVPALARVFPAWATTLARAAAHQAAAAALQDDLAAIDAQAAGASDVLQRAVLAALPEHRAANLLRWFLRRRGLPAPSAARLAAMLEQLRSARSDAEVRLRHAGAELGLMRGSIVVHAPPPAPFDIAWTGQDVLWLPHGRLSFSTTPGSGVDARVLTSASVSVRSRRGGERFQLAPGRPRRALKSILQEAGIPAWERAGLPLVYSGSVLVAVACIGVDAASRAPPGGPGISIEWTPGRD